MWVARNNYNTGNGYIDQFYVMCMNKPTRRTSELGKETGVQFVDDSGITYIKTQAHDWEKHNPGLILEPGQGPYPVTVEILKDTEDPPDA